MGPGVRRGDAWGKWVQPLAHRSDRSGAGHRSAKAMNGQTRADLAALIGQSRPTEILARKRMLTLGMIRKIAAAWAVPERVLVQEYVLAV